MEPLFIEGNSEAPTIYFNPQEDRFEITGKSIAQDSGKHFQPAIAWLNAYAESEYCKTHLHVQLDYFNLSTGSLLISVLRTLDRIAQRGCDARVFWHLQPNDEDMLELGNDLSQLVAVPFEMCQQQTAPVAELV